MSELDFTALDQHRARDQQSKVNADATLWETHNLSHEVSYLAGRGETDGTVVSLSRQVFANALRGWPEDESGKIRLIYVWGGNPAGSHHVARHAESTRTARYKGSDRPYSNITNTSDVHGFLLDPHRSLTAPAASWYVDPYTAFDKLWNPANRTQSILKGMGTAYGTKVLYWAWRPNVDWDRPLPAPVPLIYDIHVHRALNSLDLEWSDGGDPSRFDDPKGCVRYSGYAAYCTFAWLAADTLTQIRAREEGTAFKPFTPDDVEYWLFATGSSAGEVQPPPTAASVGTGGGPDDEPGDEDQVADADWDAVRNALQHVAELFDFRIYVTSRDVGGTYTAATT